MDQSTLLPEDTLASLSAWPGNNVAKTMTAISGRKCAELLNGQDLAGCCVKMLLVTSNWVSTKCYLNWSPSATPGGRPLFRLVPSMPDTDEIASGLWPTPTASEAIDCAREVSWNARSPRIKSNQGTDGQARIGDIVGGRPHPRLLEWLMGYPDRWTETEDSETPSCRKSPLKSSAP